MLDLDCYLCYNADAFLESVLQGGAHLKNSHPLRLNVGFLLHKSVGYSRNFDFDVDNVQVDSDLDVSALQGSINITRTSQGLYARGRMQAMRGLDCVRCLATYSQPLSVDVDDLFIYPPSDAEDPQLAIPETGILDLKPVLREYLLLDVPIQPLCRPDCKGLCAICGENLNDTDCQHPEADIDPRMEVLKTLLPKS
ncbi:MAG: hypothetical protein GTO14_06950 [Anaerolineales bacterium]|nr:hypothetical protein [Anaerolineales bacterium]